MEFWCGVWSVVFGLESAVEFWCGVCSGILLWNLEWSFAWSLEWNFVVES